MDQFNAAFLKNKGVWPKSAKKKEKKSTSPMKSIKDKLRASFQGDYSSSDAGEEKVEEMQTTMNTMF